MNAFRCGLLSAICCVLACSPPDTPQAQAQSAGSEGAYRLELVATGLEVPWSIAFAPDGRVFVTERPGRVRVIEGGKLNPKPVHTFSDVASRSEEGLMGLALHPQFQKNRWLYVCYATAREGKVIDRVVRFTESNTTLTQPRVILDNIPAARFHAGCELKFGPDSKLYVTTGDATDRQIAQDPRSLGGKILRLNDNGSVPADNPFRGSPVFSLGHRNPQGIDWHPTAGLLFETEHGPSGFDGGSGGDEVNIVEAGKNYGWPLIHHRQKKPGLESPLLEYTPAVAPASAAFYRGGRIKDYENNFFFGCLAGEQIRRVVLDPNNPRQVIADEKFLGDLGRIREVTMGPDGALYFSTSNRDGRGSPQKGDDRIFRIVPR
jgi:glucose/arabinose dehydrogenase